jgi:predicted RNase H-like HicB family nuclease
MTSLEVWERYEVRIKNLGPENSFDWLAEIPELDGCRAYGETREAALEALRAVAGVYVRIGLEDNNPLPRLCRRCRMNTADVLW